MSILTLLLIIAVLVLVGVGLYQFETRVHKIDPTIKWLIIAAVIVFAIVWLLQVTGLWPLLAGVKVGK